MSTMTKVTSTAVASIARAALGYQAVPEELKMAEKLTMYRDLANEAMDPYRKRPIREAGEDLARMLESYGRAVTVNRSPAVVDGFIDSLRELSDLVADMMNGCPSRS